MSKEILAKLINREDLRQEESRALFNAIMSDALDPPLMAAILTALACKRETVDEIVGAVEAMRTHAIRVRVPDGVSAIDTCGTGGDGKPIFNVSTCVAIVAAAAGATVAKHGNRSNARPSGSAEVLTALGVNLEADVPTLERCLTECRVAFLYAVRLHPAMKFAAPVRKALGIRTIFNLVGPLTNPAGVRRQLLGVNRPELAETMCHTLRQLGSERAMVVHGREGLCDLSIAGPSLVACWDGHEIRVDELTPAAAGLESHSLEQLRVTGPDESAAMIRSVLAGNSGSPREMVLLNTAAALWVTGVADDLPHGAQLAATALDTGAAQDSLNRWIATSHAQPSLRGAGGGSS